MYGGHRPPKSKWKKVGIAHPTFKEYLASAQNRHYRGGRLGEERGGPHVSGAGRDGPGRG